MEKYMKSDENLRRIEENEELLRSGKITFLTPDLQNLILNELRERIQVQFPVTFVGVCERKAERREDKSWPECG